MIKPIEPNQVAQNATKPDAVLEVFNVLIVKYWDGKQAIVGQNEAVEMIVSKMGISRNDVFKNMYLDIEDIYRQEGWDVDYDKPAYNEEYHEPVFAFSVKK